MTEPTYQPGSAFESCPAATSDMSDDGNACRRCPAFPDGAHRCAGERGHLTPNSRDLWHTCTCGASWLALVASPPELARMLIDLQAAGMRRATESRLRPWQHAQ